MVGKYISRFLLIDSNDCITDSLVADQLRLIYMNSFTDRFIRIFIDRIIDIWALVGWLLC